MRISTSQLYLQGLRSIQDQQAQLSKVSSQLASGKRIVSPADDPAASASIVSINEDIKRLERYQTNADQATSRLSLTEQTLDSSIDVMQRLRELAVLGLNDTQSASARQDIANEGRQLLDQMIALANTTDANGEHIFAGYQSQTEPFSHDGAGNFTYNGDQGQRFVAIADNRRIAVTDSGSEVFLEAPSGGTRSAMTVMWDFVNDLESNAPTPDILDDIDAVMDNISATRSSIGARHRNIELQKDQNESTMIRMQQTLSGLEDLDFAEATTSLSQHMAALEAAQVSFSRIQNLSLFNLLGG